MKCPQTEEYCSQAEHAADMAVRKVFAILGVDVDKPESVEEFREDLRFGRRLRRYSDHVAITIFGLVAFGLAVALWEGIVSKVSGVGK